MSRKITVVGLNAATAVTRARQAAEDAEAAAAAAVDISNIATPDTVVEALIEGTAGAGPLTRAALSASFAQAVVLRGTGIDPTGVADSTAATQALLDGLGALGVRLVQVAAGDVLRLTASVTVPAAVRLVGPGELRWTAGIANAPALILDGDDSAVEGVTLTNPNELGADSGSASFGIIVRGNNCRVCANVVDGFQTGIAVDANGEWVDYQIIGNRVKDVIGAGGGIGSGSTAGEDRGDGIVSWGGRGVIANNVVNAKASTDARVGVHVEALGAFEVTTPDHASELVTITGNTVYGTFRRGIVNEGVSAVAITGNSVADSTWWGIAVLTEHQGSVVTGNTIVWTRQAGDDQGSVWSPSRAPLMIYGAVEGAVVAENSIVLDGVASALIFLQSDGVGGATDCRIAGNVVTVRTGSVDDGLAVIGATAATGLTLEGNRLAGFDTHGLYLAGVSDAVVIGNRLAGTSAGYGIRGPLTNAHVSGNRITGCTLRVDSFDHTVETDIPVWQTPTLLNSWTDAGFAGHAPVGFWRAADGRVYLRGNITGGALNSPAFTLPAGCRPSHIHILRGQGANATSLRVDIEADGDVIATSEGTYDTYVSLSGLSVAVAA